MYQALPLLSGESLGTRLCTRNMWHHFSVQLLNVWAQHYLLLDLSDYRFSIFSLPTLPLSLHKWAVLSPILGPGESPNKDKAILQIYNSCTMKVKAMRQSLKKFEWCFEIILSSRGHNYRPQTILAIELKSEQIHDGIASPIHIEQHMQIEITGQQMGHSGCLTLEVRVGTYTQDACLFVFHLSFVTW